MEAIEAGIATRDEVHEARMEAIHNGDDTLTMVLDALFDALCIIIDGAWNEYEAERAMQFGH